MLSAKMTNKKERLLNSEMTEKEKRKKYFANFVLSVILIVTQT
jgi:hypothetical protein